MPGEFPIKTATACQLKWAWSSLYLNIGQTGSCWRTSFSDLTPDNFDQFHNTPIKIKDRQDMLQGKWPENNCGYCREIEAVGGSSDRMLHLSMPNLVPDRLWEDASATEVHPKVIDVLFNNTCNLGCLYCCAGLSSTINQENAKFGTFQKAGVHLQSAEGTYRSLEASFWRWFETGFPRLSRLHVLGGEPLLMKEFQTLLDYIERFPNPDCEINIVTNLMITESRLRSFIDTFRSLILRHKIRRVDISASIDCWGPQQEYVRWGLNLDQWQKNFLILCQEKWLKLNISQVVTPLTIGTMADLMIRLNEWRLARPIGQYFGDATPSPDYLKINIFGDIFLEDFERTLSVMPEDTDEQRAAKQNMRGLMLRSAATGPAVEQIRDLLFFLDEKDRRRGTDWKDLFPWLTSYTHLIDEDQHVV